jgi:hypothetical protein
MCGRVASDYSEIKIRMKFAPDALAPNFEQTGTSRRPQLARNKFLVPLAGIEPALLAELDFESSASTNSATGAHHASAGRLRSRSRRNIAGALGRSTRVYGLTEAQMPDIERRPAERPAEPMAAAGMHRRQQMNRLPPHSTHPGHSSVIAPHLDSA